MKFSLPKQVSGTLSRIFLATTLSIGLAGCGGSTDQAQNHHKVTSLANSHAVSNSISLTQDLNRFSLSKSGAVYSLTEKNNLTLPQVLSAQIERIHFADTSLALDIYGNAGKLFRLYQAAFDRTPDSQGLGYWITAVDDGITLEQSAEAFIHSAEFERAYGLNPSDEIFLNHLYNNVLHRAGDPGGLNFWLTLLKQGQSRAKVLLAFAESDENKGNLAPKIANGILYTLPNTAYRPVAHIGAPVIGTLGATLTFDGSASSDANHDNLTYQWTLLSKPALSNAQLSSLTALKPTLPTDQIGRYELSLVVNDGKNASNVTTLGINVFRSGMGVVNDTGRYLCANLSSEEAHTLYFTGHLYLDRDHDGRPCEANDKKVEITSPPVIVPPVVIPPIVVTPTLPTNSGMCWVNGYYRKSGTYVSGYYRRC